MAVPSDQNSTNTAQEVENKKCIWWEEFKLIIIIRQEGKGWRWIKERSSVVLVFCQVLALFSYSKYWILFWSEKVLNSWYLSFISVWNEIFLSLYQKEVQLHLFFLFVKVCCLWVAMFVFVHQSLWPSWSFLATVFLNVQRFIGIDSYANYLSCSGALHDLNLSLIINWLTLGLIVAPESILCLRCLRAIILAFSAFCDSQL